MRPKPSSSPSSHCRPDAHVPPPRSASDPPFGATPVPPPHTRHPPAVPARCASPTPNTSGRRWRLGARQPSTPTPSARWTRSRSERTSPSGSGSGRPWRSWTLWRRAPLRQTPRSNSLAPPSIPRLFLRVHGHDLAQPRAQAQPTARTAKGAHARTIPHAKTLRAQHDALSPRPLSMATAVSAQL
eukprot:scaffold1864_cov106-Isochrysis_galbana.AAC.12